MNKPAHGIRLGLFWPLALAAAAAPASRRPTTTSFPRDPDLHGDTMRP